MKLLTRLTASIQAETERVASRFENHDAIAAAAVRSARESVTTARVRHARLLREDSRQRDALVTLEKDEQRWTERARVSATTDEANALACLEQRRLCRSRIADASKGLIEHERLLSEMAERLATLERRLAELIRRRESLRSRESIVRAGEVLDNLCADSEGGIEDVFDRWEIRIADTDVGSHRTEELSGYSSTTGLQRRYETFERNAELRAELGELLEGQAESSESTRLLNEKVQADRQEQGHD